MLCSGSVECAFTVTFTSNLLAMGQTCQCTLQLTVHHISWDHIVVVPVTSLCGCMSGFRNTFVVQHPIAAFLQGWDRLNMPERLRRVVGKPLSFDIASFVSSQVFPFPMRYVARLLTGLCLRMDDFRLLHVDGLCIRI